MLKLDIILKGHNRQIRYSDLSPEEALVVVTGIAVPKERTEAQKQALRDFVARSLNEKEELRLDAKVKKLWDKDVDHG